MIKLVCSISHAWSREANISKLVVALGGLPEFPVRHGKKHRISVEHRYPRLILIQDSVELQLVILHLDGSQACCLLALNFTAGRFRPRGGIMSNANLIIK